MCTLEARHGEEYPEKVLLRRRQRARYKRIIRVLCDVIVWAKEKDYCRFNENKIYFLRISLTPSQITHNTFSLKTTERADMSLRFITLPMMMFRDGSEEECSRIFITFLISRSIGENVLCSAGGRLGTRPVRNWILVAKYLVRQII